MTIPKELTNKIDARIYSELQLENFTIDNSTMNIFAICPRKFFYRKILNLVPAKQAPALTFGSAFHAGLEAYYSGLSPVEVLTAFARVAKEENSTLLNLRADSKASGTPEEYSIEAGLDLMAKYMDHYPLAAERFKVMRDKNNKPLLEQGFALHLSNGIIVGKIDGLIDEGDLLENKTTREYLKDDYLLQYTVHNQISIYMAAVRELFGRTPKKCIVNCIMVKDYKKQSEERDNKLFKRVVVTRSDSQLDQTLRQFEFRINQIKNFLRVGFDAFYQNAPEACTFKFKVCEYQELCMAQEQDLVEMLMWGGNYKEEMWEPYDISGAKEVIDINVKE